MGNGDSRSAPARSPATTVTVVSAAMSTSEPRSSSRMRCSSAADSARCVAPSAGRCAISRSFTTSGLALTTSGRFARSTATRGLHSSTFRLKLSAVYATGVAFRGYVGGF